MSHVNLCILPLRSICVTNDHGNVLFVVIIIHLSSCMTYHWVGNKSTMTDATCGQCPLSFGHCVGCVFLLQRYFLDMLVVSRRLQYRHIEQEFLANKVLLMNVHITRRFFVYKVWIKCILAGKANLSEWHNLTFCRSFISSDFPLNIGLIKVWRYQIEERQPTQWIYM
jgi:hypothetical protein